MSAKPNIDTDPIMVIQGGSIPLLPGPIMERASDAAPIWVKLVPDKLSEHEENGIYPRERCIRITHDTVIGTVEELVENYRQKLTAAWKAVMTPGEDGNIPIFGEPTARKQTQTFDNHVLPEHRLTGCDLKCTRQALEHREAARNNLTGFKPRQDAWTRWELTRLVAQFHNGKRFYDNDTSSGLLPPTDDLTHVRALIDALTILRDDRIQYEQQQRDKAQAKETPCSPT